MTGIYIITNRINGKQYVGQSLDIERRWRQHKRLGDRYKNTLLYKAMVKYGKSAFSFEVIEECDVEKLDEKEIYYIRKFDTFRRGYNMTTGGGGQHCREMSEEHKEAIRLACTGRKHTPEECKKISEKLTGRKFSLEHREKLKKVHLHRSAEWQQKLSDSHKGKKASDETRAKLSEAFKGRVFTTEWKQKLREYALNRPPDHEQKLSDCKKGEKNPRAKRVYCDNRIFVTAKSCADFYNVPPATMGHWLRGDRKIPEKFVTMGLRYV